MVTTEEDAEAVLNGLIECLTRTPTAFKYSTTVDFKLIPFQNHAIGRDGITELITRQNNFLHNSMATSVVDGGNCRQHIDNEGQSIVEICMDARGADGTYIFDSAEPGHANQCNFLHPKHMREEAEAFLDGVFAHLHTSYGSEYCRRILGGEGHVRREAKVKNTPKIAEYLQNLRLTSVADIVQKREAGLLMPPQNKRKKVPIVVYGRGQGTAWGSKLHDDDLTTDTRPAPSAKQSGAPVPSSQTSLAPSVSTSVSTLESDLNRKMEEANERRKADAALTKRELTRMEERMTEQLTSVSKRLENHDTGLTLLHEGQMHLETNLKMLMKKMGVTPSNPTSLPPAEPSTNAIVESTSDTVRDLDGDFTMTEETFDNVLADCSRTRERRTDNKRKVPSPTDLTEDGDPDL